MQKYFTRIKPYIVAHKVISALVVVVLLGGAYFVYGKVTSTTGETRYVTETIGKSTLTTSISGSGQVSASKQVDLKSKVSGDIVYLPVQSGQNVSAGTLIAMVDVTDAQKVVRNAEISLETAQLSLEELQEPADSLSLLQAQNNLDKAKETKQNAEDSLKKAYEDGFNTVSNVYLDLPGIMSGLNDIFFKSNNSTGQPNLSWYEGQVGASDREKAATYGNDVVISYNTARKAYDASFASYKLLSRASSNEIIEASILDTYNTTKTIADTIKTSSNYLDFVKDSMDLNNYDIPTLLTTHKTSLNSYTSKANTDLISLLAIKQTIESAKQTITNADRSIAENTESLAKIKAPADALDLRSAKILVDQGQSALDDAKDALADCYVYAPFAGTISSTSVEKGDSVTSGTAIATLITQQQIAEISLNEVDAAKIKVGQKATIIFDAIPDLTMTGKVSEVDSVGTVSQGVVTYNIKISFDTQDDRIKPGMSVSATVITDVKQDVLVVSSGAIKTQNGESYVETFDSALSEAKSGVQGSTSAVAPTKITVEIGISDDTQTEITSGLKEGDIVVTKTIAGTTTTSNTKTSTTSSTKSTGSILNSISGGGGPRD